jgi:hypothetical protein
MKVQAVSPKDAGELTKAQVAQLPGQINVVNQVLANVHSPENGKDIAYPLPVNLQSPQEAVVVERIAEAFRDAGWEVDVRGAEVGGVFTPSMLVFSDPEAIKAAKKKEAAKKRAEKKAAKEAEEKEEAMAKKPAPEEIVPPEEDEE